MLWWCWQEAPSSVIFVSACDRDPSQFRPLREVGVTVQVRSREEAMTMCRALNRRQGIPIGWPTAEEKANLTSDTF